MWPVVRVVLALAALLLVLPLLAGCEDPGAEQPAAVDYVPEAREDWPVSTPEEQGLDPKLVAAMYRDADRLDTIYGLLVVKNGYLVAEKYYHEGAIDRMDNRQSVAKSYISALMGLALDQGCLSSIDQKMMDFFPEFVDQIQDPRKMEITIRQMLQARTGYPWEETDDALWEALWSGDYLHLVVDFPLVSDPGTKHHYSNLTAHWLGVIVARACDTDLKTFGEEHLFSPIGAAVDEWPRDLDGYYWGAGEMRFTARDMAKFGQLYLNDGQWDGQQIIPADWVHDSLQTYSENAWTTRVGRNFRDVGYGYQWWSVQAGDHRFNLAWGHGGQAIALMDELDLVVVLTADPLYGETGGGPWGHEKANLNLVADFIASLP